MAESVAKKTVRGSTDQYQTSDAEFIESIADQLCKLPKRIAGFAVHWDEVAIELIEDAIEHGAFSGAEWRTMMAKVKRRRRPPTTHDPFHTTGAIWEFLEWLQEHRPDLCEGRNRLARGWNYELIADALREEANKMQRASKDDGHTSTDDEDIAANDMAAPTIISAAIAEQRYAVNAQTIGEAVRNGELTDYRSASHAKNAPHRLNEREVANRWPKR